MESIEEDLNSGLLKHFGTATIELMEGSGAVMSLATALTSLITLYAF